MGSKLSKNRLHAIRATLLLLVAGLIFSAWQSASAGIPPGAILISEFRLRGPNGANDEFIEIYNNSTAAHTVQTSDGSAGYALVASDGVARFVIPNGTVIPGRGHYLGVNSVGYSLSSYPAGKGKTATGDITYTVDIPDNAGIALFNTANPANFTLANRLDAVGSTSEPNMLYKEGTGYPALTPFSIDYSFYRNLSNGLPRDTGVNVIDFVFVDTNGTSAGAGQRLGAPGPENLSSPIRRKGENAISRIAPGKCVGCSPNYVRDNTSDPANNAAFGKLDIRRKFTNTSNTPVKRLRFRITDISTFPSPPGTADLRPISSTDVSIPQGNVILQVKGTTLEQSPAQPNGGGFNSSMSVDAVTLANPLAPGASLDFRLLLGVQQTGRYRFAIQVETFPATNQSVYMMVGDTESGHFEARPAGDFDNDFITDFATWRLSTGTWVISKSTTNGGTVSKVFGQNGDRPAPADYDGDGKTDLAVFRPGDQSFHILQSSDDTEKVKQFGQATDVPVPGDYDGDAKADMALYRPANSTFYVLKSSNNTSFSKKWGTAGDVAVPCDYDGDHRTDYVIYRPSTGDWIIFKSTTNTSVKQNVGVSGGTPATGDFDGDGRDDLSVLSPANSGWFVKRSSGQGFIFQSWGGPGDVPQPGDYDGDGQADFGVWRDSTHQFLVAPSGGWSFDKSLGKSGDLPVSTAMVTP